MTWRPLLEEAAAMLRDKRHHDALQLCDRCAQLGEDARYHAAILRGDVLLDLGDPAGALSSYEAVADPARADPVVDCARGIALFELGRFAEAENALQSAVRGRPDLAEAFFALALMAEIQESGMEVEYFRHARRLAPDRFPPKPRITQEQFHQLLTEATQALGDEDRARLTQVELAVVELPSAVDLAAGHLRLSPLSLAVLIPENTLQHMVSPEGSWEVPLLVLFKRNLERAASEPVALAERILESLVHELELVPVELTNQD